MVEFAVGVNQVSWMLSCEGVFCQPAVRSRVMSAVGSRVMSAVGLSQVSEMRS